MAIIKEKKDDGIGRHVIRRVNAFELLPIFEINKKYLLQFFNASSNFKILVRKGCNVSNTNNFLHSNSPSLIF